MHIPNPATPDLRDAVAYCERLARGHYENFPVGSRLVPARLRRHVWAIYAFARIADDFADEEQHAGQRLRRLAEWRDELNRCVQNQNRVRHPVFVALGQTIRRFQLPVQLLHDLITAFEMDCTRGSWPDWPALLHYCRHSANPIGRLVLWLFGYRDERRARWSDCICTALQLINFWQDVGLDLDKGRVYIPEADLAAHGTRREDIEARRVDERLVALMREMIARTRALLTRGRALPQHVSGRLRYELRLTWLGGSAVLDAIEGAGHNVFVRPTLGKRRWVTLAGQALWGRRFLP